jgi:hypothetical protein
MGNRADRVHRFIRQGQLRKSQLRDNLVQAGTQDWKSSARPFVFRKRTEDPEPEELPHDAPFGAAYFYQIAHRAGRAGDVVETGSTGQVAGIETGDGVTSIGGRPIVDLHHFHEVLARHRIGEAVEVSVWRDGQTVTLRAVLEQET